MEPEAIALMKELREKIQTLVNKVRELRSKPMPIRSEGGSDTGEMIANIMLSLRHLEDSRMRLGKAIQAYEGGVSVYDKQTEAS